jgi:Cys-tRNA(Pro)/Cys-tRNA(Cys) deacylase
MSAVADTLDRVHPRVRGALERHGIDATVHVHERLGAPISSPDDVAEALGLDVARIAKSLFLRRRGGGEFALAVTSVHDRVDWHAVADIVGVEPLELARPDELHAVLGYSAAGVSPLGAPPEVPVAVDRRLLDEETILVGGGRSGVEVELAPADLVAATGAVVAHIREEL